MSKKLSRNEGFNPRKIRTRTTVGAVSAGIIALIFVLVTFVASLYFFPQVPSWADSRLAGPLRLDWTALGGITSLATFSLVVGGVLFALIDYIQNAVQRKRDDAEASFNIYKEMFNRLMSPEALEARRWVILNLPTLEEMGNDKKAYLDQVNKELNKMPRGWKSKRPPGREYLKDILNTLDFIGFVAKHYWNMENELVEWMSSPVTKVWERISVYVEEESKLRNELDYYESARNFANYCVEWRRQKYPKSNVIPNGT